MHLALAASPNVAVPLSSTGPSVPVHPAPLVASERPTEPLARGAWQVPPSSIAITGVIVVLSGALYFAFFMLRPRLQRKRAR